MRQLSVGVKASMAAFWTPHRLHQLGQTLAYHFFTLTVGHSARLLQRFTLAPSAQAAVSNIHWHMFLADHMRKRSRGMQVKPQAGRSHLSVTPCAPGDTRCNVSKKNC